MRVRLTWNFSIVSSEREHRFIRTSVQTINEAVLCTRLQHTSLIIPGQSSQWIHQTARPLTRKWHGEKWSQTEAPGPMAVIWTAAVVQDRRPVTHTALWLVRLSRAALWLVKSFSTSWPTCHMIRWWEFEPQTGGNSASEPATENQIQLKLCLKYFILIGQWCYSVV